MAIAQDKSDLKPGKARKGLVPLVHDELLDHLMAGLDGAMREHRGYGETDVRPVAVEGAGHRHSDSGGCSRRTSYLLRGVERSNPMTVIEKWNAFVGTVLHEWVDEGFRRTLPHAEFEVVTSLLIPITDRDGAPVVGLDGIEVAPLLTAGHADLRVDMPTADGPKRVVGEYKTQGGFRFKKNAGFQGEAQGPPYGGLVQACMNARALDADEVWMLDIAKELVAKAYAEDYGLAADDPHRGFSTWVFDRDYIRRVSDFEIRRLVRIVELNATGQKVPRSVIDNGIPKGARIVDPVDGRWQVVNEDGSVADTGTSYLCIYCSHQDVCIADGP